MKYVLMTPELGGMGGNQMFAYNKGLYLRNMGWDVYYCFFIKSEIRIKGFDSFKSYYLPESIWGIEHYSKGLVDNRIDDVIKGLGLSNGEDIIIESNLMSLSFWAEILAKKINGCHVLNCLEENIPHYHAEVYKYLEFKLKRRECLNASEYSLRRTFKEYYKPEYLLYENRIKTPCSNVLSNEDDGYDVEPFKSADYNIISIGRLDKPYIPKTISEVIKIICSHKDKKFNIVFVGASKDGLAEREIEEQMRVLNNVHLFFLGYMFPIPSVLLKSMDVSLATSNSVLVSYNVGIPTIAIDAQDFEAIGIYGYNTTNKVFRHGEPVISVGDYLEKVLFDKSFKYEKLIINIEDNSNEEFSKQLSYVTKYHREKEYYPVHDLFSLTCRIKNITIRVLYTIKHSCLRS